MSTLDQLLDRHGLRLIAEGPSRSGNGLWMAAVEPLPEPRGRQWPGAVRTGDTMEEALVAVWEAIEEYEATPWAPPKRRNQHEAWTREACIDAGLVYMERYGYWPTSISWDPSYARAKGHAQPAQHYIDDGCYPSVTAVRRLFGTWHDFIVACRAARWEAA